MMRMKFLGGVFLLLTAVILSGCGLIPNPFRGEATATPTAQGRLEIEIQAPEKVVAEPPAIEATVPVTITTNRSGELVSANLLVTFSGPITSSISVGTTAGIAVIRVNLELGIWKITAANEEVAVSKELLVVQRQLVQVPTPTPRPVPPTPTPTRVPLPTPPSPTVPAAPAPAPKAGVPNAGIDLDPIDRLFAWIADSLRGR